MSEPTSPDDSAVGPPEHLHPFFLLTGLGGSLRGMAGGYAAIGYLVVSGRWRTAGIGMVLLLLFMAVGVFLHWRRFEYRVGENEIRIDSEILSRTHRSIPFDRIQDVDITQGPLARAARPRPRQVRDRRLQRRRGGRAAGDPARSRRGLADLGPIATRPACGCVGRGRRGVGRAATSLCDGPEAAHSGGDLQLLARGVRGPVRPELRRSATSSASTPSAADSG